MLIRPSGYQQMARGMEGAPCFALSLGDALVEIAAQLGEVVGVVLRGGSCEALDDVLGPPAITAQEVAAHADSVGDADGLGGAHRRRELLRADPILAHRIPQLSEARDEHLKYVVVRRLWHARARQQLRRLALDQRQLLRRVPDREHGLEVEAALQR